MGPDRQLEQLCALYAERSDTELLALHEQRDDLTDLAQEALAQVMKERRLSASVVPVEVAEIRDPDRFPGPLTGDEIELVTFFDAFQASEAIRNLEAAEIPHRMVDWNELSGRRGRVRLGMIVSQRDAGRAKHLLQETMNLFPSTEGLDVSEIPEDLHPVSLGRFEREGALLVAHALGTAGISYIWTDDLDQEDAHDDLAEIEVFERRLAEARQVAQQALESHV